MDGDGPYERYYAEREAAGKRTVVWPWVLLAVVVPLLLVRTFVTDDEPPPPIGAAAGLHAPQPHPAAVTRVADGRFRVGPVLVPGHWVTDGPAAGRACAYSRTGPGTREAARAAVHGRAAAELVVGEAVTFSGGCAWSLR